MAYQCLHQIELHQKSNVFICLKKSKVTAYQKFFHATYSIVKRLGRIKYQECKEQQILTRKATCGPVCHQILADELFHLSWIDKKIMDATSKSAIGSL